VGPQVHVVTGSFLRRYPGCIPGDRRPGRVDMAAQVVVANDITIATVEPTGRSIEWGAEAGAAEHLVVPGVLDHSRPHVGGENGDGIVQGAILGSAVRKPLTVVVGVHVRGEEELALVIQATGALGSLFGPRQGRQEERGQDGDDGDDHEQFDQSEGRVFMARQRVQSGSPPGGYRLRLLGGAVELARLARVDRIGQPRQTVGSEDQLVGKPGPGGGRGPGVLVARTSILGRRLESIGVPLAVLTTNCSCVLFRNWGKAV